MTKKNHDNVLSLSAEADLLARREAFLQSAGFQVLSTTSEMQIRFEVQMGQCGVLLLCYTIHQAIHRDLAKLFTKNCKGSAIVCVMHPEQRKESPHAHLNLLDSDFPHKLHLIRHLQTQHNKTA